MKITYLGTAASEGLPAPFCTCPVCQKARSEGGKSVRTRSQALVDESLLIDFPADTYFHWLQNGFDFLKVRDLIVTHSHCDHWYPMDLFTCVEPYAHHGEYSLTLHGNEKVCGEFQACMEGEEPRVLQVVHAEQAQAYQTFTAGEYQVTPCPPTTATPRRPSSTSSRRGRRRCSTPTTPAISWTACGSTWPPARTCVWVW